MIPDVYCILESTAHTVPEKTHATSALCIWKYHLYSLEHCPFDPQFQTFILCSYCSCFRCTPTVDNIDCTEKALTICNCEHEICFPFLHVSTSMSYKISETYTLPVGGFSVLNLTLLKLQKPHYSWQRLKRCNRNVFFHLYFGTLVTVLNLFFSIEI